MRAFLFMLLIAATLLIATVMSTVNAALAQVNGAM